MEGFSAFERSSVIVTVPHLTIGILERSDICLKIYGKKAEFQIENYLLGQNGARTTSRKEI